jgi:RNA recognition motif-containing protein
MNDQYISSGQSRGYAFVEMLSQSEGKAAITALSGKTLEHMTIDVVEALPLSDKRGMEWLQGGDNHRFNRKVRQRR